MNPLSNVVHFPTNTEAELDRLQQVAEQLGGFDERLSLEWLDGAMTAIAAGRRPPKMAAEWRDALLGDAFARAFSDPHAEREATAVLQARWHVLQKQLDPELLLDAPDELRLAPVMFEWTDEERAELVAQGEPEEEIPLTAEVWAHGFIEAMEAFPEAWPEPDMESETGDQQDDALLRIVSLTMRSEEDLADLRESWGGEMPSRDEMIQEALFAVQDLRVFWIENAPRPETRRVGEQPGRNDPCPCGSGKKFKKCHG